jgi:hypothetical protein
MAAGNQGIETANFAGELARAGAGSGGVWGRMRHLIWRHPLGAAGAIIIAVLAFGALFADLITVYDPLRTDSSISLARPTLRIGWAPTSWAATSTAASSTAPASRLPSGSARRRSAASSASPSA